MDCCSRPGCQRSGISIIGEDGEICSGPTYCYDHHPDKIGITAAITKYIETHETIVGLNASGIHLADMDLTNKKFYGCSFNHCIFSNVHAENCRSRISSFDFTIFSDCNLQKSNFQFCSFAGSVFSHMLFTNSELVHNNFCGLTSVQSSFDDSDLYNSRFIRSKLSDTSIRNCNIKKAIFIEMTQDNVSFKLSNTREAVFSPGVTLQ